MFRLKSVSGRGPCLAYVLVTIVAVFVGFFAFVLQSEVLHAQTITVPKPGVPVSLRVHDTDIRIEGCVSPNSLVSIINDFVVVGTTTSGNDGKYEQELTAQTPTIHTMGTYFDDPANRRSSYTEDVIALPPKQLTVLSANPAPTVEHAPDSVEAGKNITFRGYACPGATVVIAIDNNTTLTAVANSAGYWTVTLNSINFTVGSHTYTVSAKRPGYESSVSQKYQFSVYTAPDGTESPMTIIRPGIDTVDISEPVVIDQPDDGYRSTTRDVVVSGTGPSNAQIELFIDGILVGSVFSNPFGEWSLIVNDLKDQQVITARACNQLRCGDISNSVKVFLGGSGSELLPNGCDLKLYSQEYRYNALVVGKGIDLLLWTEGASPRYRLVIDWGDLVVDHQTIDSRQLITHHTYKQTGHYNAKIIIHQDDNLNCKDVVYFSVRVVESPTSWPWARYIVIGSIVIISIRFLLLRKATNATSS